MPADRLHRKLAAIVAADLVGYSRLMAADEELTLAQIKALRKEVIDPTIREHDGRIVKTTGDGMLIEFASAVDAVRVAFEVQTVVAERNQEVPADRRLVFRVGINVGDVLMDDDDIFGDGVNVAARLEGIAEPGSIFVSDSVYRQVRGKVPCEFDDLGPRTVKNLDEPIHTYRVKLAAGNGSEAPAAVDQDVLTRPAVAVLPFDNMSGDPEQEYFVDGLTEDIITALCLWRSFPVIARNSCFIYKGTSVKVQQVVKELGARYVLEGSVRKAGARVRVTAQLIDGLTGHHVWAERFDRKLDDIFEVQDEITQVIAATVEPEIARAEQRRTIAKPPTDLNAWDLYQRGIGHLNTHSVDGIARAREMFDKALALDPTYSKAYSALSFSHTLDLLLEHVTDREAAFAAVLENARQAVTHDATDSIAHVMLSIGFMWQNQDDRAIAEAEKALELNPSNAFAYSHLGNLLDLTGQSEAGIENLAKGIQLSPRDPLNHIFMTFLSRANVTARHYDEGVAWANKAIQSHEHYPNAHYMLAVALGHLGQETAVAAALDECERMQPGFVQRRANWRPYRNEAANEHIWLGLAKSGKAGTAH